MALGGTVWLSPASSPGQRGEPERTHQFSALGKPARRSDKERADTVVQTTESTENPRWKGTHGGVWSDVLVGKRGMPGHAWGHAVTLMSIPFIAGIANIFSVFISWWSSFLLSLRAPCRSSLLRLRKPVTWARPLTLPRGHREKQFCRFALAPTYSVTWMVN